MVCLNYKNVFEKINKYTFYILSILSVIFCISILLTTSSCRTTQDGDTKLSAVSDKDYKLSFIKSESLSDEPTNVSADAGVQEDRRFFEFVVCSVEDSTNCINAFKTDDGTHLAFNVIDFDSLQSNLSLTDGEFSQIKNQMNADGIISDVQKEYLKEFGIYGAAIGTGAGIGHSASMFINNLTLYNADVLDSRITASAKISQLNDALFVTKQLKFKRTYSVDSKILKALNKSYTNSLALSELFLNRDRDFAKIFKEVANDKNLKTQSDEIVELFSKKSFTIDQMFLSKLQTKLTTMKSTASSLASQTGSNAGVIDTFYLSQADHLEILQKKITQATSKNGKVSTKQILASLSDYYGKTIDNNSKLVTSIQSELDDTFFASFKKTIISAKKTVGQAKTALALHAEVLNKWYSKPLFHGSKLDALGRKIDDAAIKTARGIGTAARQADELAGGIKSAGRSAADKISSQAARLAKKQLAKPLMIVVGTALAGGVVFGAVKLTTQSEDSSQQPEDDQSQQGDSQAASDHAQFYEHLHHALSTDTSVDKKVTSVDQFIDHLAKFLNTNVLRSEQNEISIQSVCLPASSKQEQGNCRAVSS